MRLEVFPLHFQELLISKISHPSQTAPTAGLQKFKKYILSRKTFH